MKKQKENSTIRRRTVLRVSGCVIAILAALITLSCEQTAVDVYDPVLNIYCVLEGDKQVHEVLVDRSYKMDEPDMLFVDDAMVVLSGCGETDTLLFADSSCTYFSDPITIQAGSTYTLTVTKEGFDTLLGTTTIPDRFDILFPHDGDTLTLLDTLSFVRDTVTFLFTISVPEVFFTYMAAWFDTDSIIGVPLYALFDDPPVASGYNYLKITAYDTSFCDYFFWEKDSLMQQGVENGVGLMGSAWVESVEVYVDFSW
jgi:sulfur relay (sulfurtransferase) DsrF/TusC family protein